MSSRDEQSERKVNAFPLLSADEGRTLEQRLEKIRTKYGLYADNPLGNQLQWLRSRERRQAIRKQRIEEMGKDYHNTFGTQFRDRWGDVPIYGSRVARRREPDSTSRLELEQMWPRYVQIVKRMPRSRDELEKFLAEMDPFEALLHDPATTGKIGLEETENYLTESLDLIAEARFPGESKESKPYEDFIASLGEIERLAIEGCIVLWPDRGDWVRRVVVPAAGDRLESAKRVWRGRAGGSAKKDESSDSSTATVMESPKGLGVEANAFSDETEESSEFEKHELRLQAIQKEFGYAPDFYGPLGITPKEYYAWKRLDRKRCSRDKKSKLETAADKLLKEPRKTIAERLDQK
jgi:hypothetical protein